MEIIMKISSLFKPLSFLPALVLMYMIYTFSSQPGSVSSATSYKVSEKIVQGVNLVAQQHWEEWKVQEYATQLNGIVRKGAHITEYFLLAIAVSFPLYVYGVRGIFLLLLAGLICVAFAAGDEYHQSMVEGRGASSRDVMIDSIGIFFGILLSRLVGWSGRMAITGPIYERKQRKKQKELDLREEELRRREERLAREEERRYAEDRRYENRPRPEMGQPHGSRSSQVAGASFDNRDPYKETGRSAQRLRPEDTNTPDRLDHTKVIGNRHEVDDRTRVYRSPEQQKKMEEDYRRQVYERRRVQSDELRDDNTSDQLSEDIPFSGLLSRKRRDL